MCHIKRGGDNVLFEMNNREIKFRAWVPQKKSMMMAGSLYFWFETIKNLKINPLESQPDSIMLQFTGLKDKNGKEIYEGDIVNHAQYGDWTRKNEVVVIIIRDLFGFIEKKGYAEGEYGETFSPESLEIIGNIYENPELLK